MFCCVCKFLRRSTKNKSKHQRQTTSSHKNKNKKKCNQKVVLTSNKLKKHQLEYQLKKQHQHQLEHQLEHKENRLSQRSRTSKITRRRIHVSVILFIISKAI